MRIIEYDRIKAVEYAKKWAFTRNPEFYDYSSIGGDCTNFVSQCLFAGVGIMNFTPNVGWFYSSANVRTASWTGVEYFYRFLINNNRASIGSGYGPFAEEVPLSQLQIGDFVQLGRTTGDYFHTPIVVGFKNNVPLLAAHSIDTYNKPLNTYFFTRLRCIHILGARTP